MTTKTIPQQPLVRSGKHVNPMDRQSAGDKVISVSGKVHLANVSANMMSENFVIDSDRIPVTLEGLHDYIFNS